jgi:hypothetical protein
VSRCMCKRLCTGGIPLLKHLLQHLPRLREPLEPSFRPPPFLPLRLQVQELVHRLLAGKLVIPHLRPPPNLPNEPLHQVGAPQVRPKRLGVAVEPQKRPQSPQPTGPPPPGTANPRPPSRPPGPQEPPPGSPPRTPASGLPPRGSGLWPAPAPGSTAPRAPRTAATPPEGRPVGWLRVDPEAHR